MSPRGSLCAIVLQGLKVHLLVLAATLSVASGVRAYAPEMHVRPIAIEHTERGTGMEVSPENRVKGQIGKLAQTPLATRRATLRKASGKSVFCYGGCIKCRVNAKARYYDSELGRFITQDSYAGEAGNPASLHKYLYAYGNPLMYVDPTGHNATIDKWIGTTQGASREIDRMGVAAQRSTQNCVDDDGDGCSNSGIDLLRGLYDLDRAATQLALKGGELALLGLNAVADATALAAHDAGYNIVDAADLASAEHNQAVFQREARQTGRALAGAHGAAVNGLANYMLDPGATATPIMDAALSGANNVFIEGDSKARSEFMHTQLGMLASAPREALAITEAGLKAAGRAAVKIADEVRDGSRAFKKVIASRYKMLHFEEVRLSGAMPPGVKAARGELATGGMRSAPTYRGMRQPKAARATTSPRLLENEFEIGRYGEISQVPGDDLTPHHMPSAEYMQQRAGIAPDRSLAMNMEQPRVGGRHRRTESYGRSPFLDETPRDALARDLMDARRIYQQDGVYGPGVRGSFQRYIELSKKTYPQLFEK